MNALKFTSEGRVTVTVETAEVSAAALDRDEADAEATSIDCVQIHVADTGRGIAPAFMPRLFEAFEQESIGLNRQFEGVGLGLSIAGGAAHARESYLSRPQGEEVAFQAESGTARLAGGPTAVLGA